jgi:hypothetical protein
MNLHRKNEWTPCLLVVLAFVLVFVIEGGRLKNVSASSREQSQFSMETGAVPVRSPKDLPQGALQLLREDRMILNCSQAAKMQPDQVPASWFVASEIHLDGSVEKDLVVQGRDLHLTPAPNRCLMGANVAPFWVLRKTRTGYSLVLSVAAHDLGVLETRSKGFRDIEAFAMTAVTGFSATYEFDGEKYQVSRTDSKPLG